MEMFIRCQERSPDKAVALQQLISDQQDKASGRYHEWLTPEQFGTQFGPSDADLQAVTQWLAAQGLGNMAVSAGRTTIEFSGTAGQVRNAFHTEIRRYAVKGEMHFANASDPAIPTALAGCGGNRVAQQFSDPVECKAAGHIPEICKDG